MLALGIEMDKLIQSTRIDANDCVVLVLLVLNACTSGGRVSVVAACFADACLPSEQLHLPACGSSIWALGCDINAIGEGWGGTAHGEVHCEYCFNFIHLFRIIFIGVPLKKCPKRVQFVFCFSLILRGSFFSFMNVMSPQHNFSIHECQCLPNTTNTDFSNTDFCSNTQRGTALDVATHFKQTNAIEKIRQFMTNS